MSKSTTKIHVAIHATSKQMSHQIMDMTHVKINAKNLPCSYWAKVATWKMTLMVRNMSPLTDLCGRKLNLPHFKCLVASHQSMSYMKYGPILNWNWISASLWTTHLNKRGISDAMFLLAKFMFAYYLVWWINIMAHFEANINVDISTNIGDSKHSLIMPIT